MAGWPMLLAVNVSRVPRHVKCQRSIVTACGVLARAYHAALSPCVVVTVLRVGQCMGTVNDTWTIPREPMCHGVRLLACMYLLLISTHVAHAGRVYSWNPCIKQSSQELNSSHFKRKLKAPSAHQPSTSTMHQHSHAAMDTVLSCNDPGGSSAAHHRAPAGCLLGGAAARRQGQSGHPGWAAPGWGHASGKCRHGVDPPNLATRVAGGMHPGVGGLRGPSPPCPANFHPRGTRVDGAPGVSHSMQHTHQHTHNSGVSCWRQHTNRQPCAEHRKINYAHHTFRNANNKAISQNARSAERQ